MLAALAICSTALAAGASGVANDPGQGEGSYSYAKYDRILGRLGLTAEQAKKINDIFKKANDQIRDESQRMRDEDPDTGYPPNMPLAMFDRPMPRIS